MQKEWELSVCVGGRGWLTDHKPPCVGIVQLQLLGRSTAAPLAFRVVDQHCGRPHSQVRQFLSYPGGLSPSMAAEAVGSTRKQINLLTIQKHCINDLQWRLLKWINKSLLEHHVERLLSGLEQRRNGEVLQVATVPVLHHQLCALLHLRHAAFAQLAVSPADLRQEIYGRSERLYLVVLQQLMSGYSLDDGVNHFFELIAVFGSVLQDELVPGQVLLEDDSGAVQQFDLAVQLHLLQRLGASWNAGDIARLVPLQTVDHTALAHVRIADKPNRDCPVGALDLGELLDELDEMIGSDGLGGVDERVGHVSAVCDGLLEEVEGREMRVLVLGVGLEHDHWVLPPEVGLPGVRVFHGHEVYFVEDEDDLLVGQREDLAFDVLAPAGQRVPRVQDLQDDVAVLNDLFDFLVVLP